MSDREPYLVAAIWFLAITAFAAATSRGAFNRNSPRKAPASAWYTEACSGCGTEWRSPEPQEPIEKCPNCPMSEQEFERLKEAVRNRNKGGER